VNDLGLVLDREIDAGQRARAEKILELAEGAVAAEFKVSLADFRSDPPANAEAVVLSVAARAFENPLTLTSESAGPWSGSYRAGGFELTPYERQQLGNADGAGVFDVSIGAAKRLNVPIALDSDAPEWVVNGPNGP
jgi:hypothetical protein